MSPQVPFTSIVNRIEPYHEPCARPGWPFSVSGSAAADWGWRRRGCGSADRWFQLGAALVHVAFAVLWDNRCTMHTATVFDASCYRRLLYRTIIA